MRIETIARLLNVLIRTQKKMYAKDKVNWMQNIDGATKWD